MDQEPPTVGVEEVANALNLTRQRVAQLVTAKILDRTDHGEYDLDDCFRRYIRYLQAAMKAKAVMNDDGAITTSSGQRNALLAVQIEGEQLDLAKKKGEVMAVNDHERVIAHLIIETKARLMAVGARVSPTLVGEESRIMIQAKIDAELKIALTELASRAPRLPVKSTNCAAGAVISIAGCRSAGVVGRARVSISKKAAGGQSRQKKRQLIARKSQLLGPVDSGKRVSRGRKPVDTVKSSPAPGVGPRVKKSGSGKETAPKIRARGGAV